MKAGMYWLPEVQNWRNRLKALATFASVDAWTQGVSLANSRLDFLQTNALDRAIRHVVQSPPHDLSSKPIRLALLGSCTLSHLHSSIRVAGLRRGIWIDIYESSYGQYLQELSNTKSALHEYAPDVILLALDGHHLAAGFHLDMAAAEFDHAMHDVKVRIERSWALARESFGCQIIQQTPLPVHPIVLGNNEHRLPASRSAVIDQLNVDLRRMADSAEVSLLSVDKRAAFDGLSYWHSTSLWHYAKQEVAPSAAPLYGELVGRILAAQRGRSFKCLALDLDNTLWGGVVGDDGLHGLQLGQGSPVGEAFAAFQSYVRDLSRRGVILAVCSKNSEENALEVFTSHPEMILRRNDIASFIANWDNKADNIRSIASNLKIGLDSIVFVDDNPAERELIRSELPMVAVPELPPDPCEYPELLSSAGYFEGLSITGEDKERTRHYQSNNARERLQKESVDLDSYLASLKMQMTWGLINHNNLQRVVQLINKTNQFNLTSRRYPSGDVEDLINNSDNLCLQLRLADRFGDNGIIGVVIGKLNADHALVIDTWLMSCRVMGRRLEPVTLNAIVTGARRMGATRLVGEYVGTKKNGVVKDHYTNLGFSVVSCCDNSTWYSLDLDNYRLANAPAELKEG